MKQCGVMTIALTLNPQNTQFQEQYTFYDSEVAHSSISPIYWFPVDTSAVKVIQLILPSYLAFIFVTTVKVPDTALDLTNFVSLSMFMILSFWVCSLSVGEVSWWTEPSALSWLVPFGEPCTELVDNFPVL